jgi:hypothetical protein
MCRLILTFGQRMERLKVKEFARAVREEAEKKASAQAARRAQDPSHYESAEAATAEPTSRDKVALPAMHACSQTATPSYLAPLFWFLFS